MEAGGRAERLRHKEVASSDGVVACVRKFASPNHRVVASVPRRDARARRWVPADRRWCAKDPAVKDREPPLAITAGRRAFENWTNARLSRVRESRQAPWVQTNVWNWEPHASGSRAKRG